MDFRIVSLLILCLALIVICFVSCASTDTFEERLEKEDYQIELADAESVEYLADIDSDDYKIKKVLLATMNEDADLEAVYIVQCGNPFAAMKLVDDLKDELDGYSEIKQSFNFVIIGSEESIAVALGK